MPNTGVIDITDLVESMRSTFVSWAVKTSHAALIATPAFSWLGLPIVSSIYSTVATKALDVISKAGTMQAFFINTAIRKPAQAQDYIDALTKKASLADTATDAEYMEAEKNEINAFNSFVRLTL